MKPKKAYWFTCSLLVSRLAASVVTPGHRHVCKCCVSATVITFPQFPFPRAGTEAKVSHVYCYLQVAPTARHHHHNKLTRSSPRSVRYSGNGGLLGSKPKCSNELPEPSVYTGWCCTRRRYPAGLELSSDERMARSSCFCRSQACTLLLKVCYRWI